MRTIDLGRTAAEAEVVRLKRLVHRQIMRAVWGAVAAVFGIAVLVMIHVVIYNALVPWTLTPVWGAVVVLAFDIVVAAIFGVLAMRGAPDALEIEAKQVRDQALAGMREGLAVSALLSPVTRLIFRTGSRNSMVGMLVASLATSFLAKARR